MTKQRYNAYSAYFRQTYGERLQKLSIDAGFGCPNREIGDPATGRAATGCTFCDNNAFNPSYCTPQKSITQQLDEGILFHEHRYKKSGHYLAYFQAYSNTYAPVDVLRARYEEALAHPKVAGLIIGTRPDCVDEEKLSLIASLKGYPKASGDIRHIAVEYGIESCYDSTLQRVNRGHDFATTRHAIELTAQHGLCCGGHLILGLPGESREMMLHEANIINTLPINTLKLHQLQILKGTRMEQEGDLPKSFELDEYITLVCDFLEQLRPNIMMERFAGEVPPRYQAQPDRSWRRPDGHLIRNEEIPALIAQELDRRDSWQGKRYRTSTPQQTHP